MTARAARRWALVASVVVFAAACGDGGDSADGDEATDTEAAALAGSFIDVGGEVYEFTNVTGCTFGDPFWGPDFRRISLDSDGDFPTLTIGYAPPKADDGGVENPNVVALFPSADPWWFTTEVAGVDDYEVTLTDDGVAGSATLGVVGQGGPDGDQFAVFEVSCGEAVTRGEEATDGDSGGDDPSTEESDGSSDAPAVDSGTVVVAGETYELTGPSRSDVLVDGDGDASAGDFDFEICETVNPAFEGDFNISGTLGDGTPFRLSGNVDDISDEFNGLFIGESVDEERADGLEVSLSDRTLSGTATTSRGDIEFSFTC